MADVGSRRLRLLSGADPAAPAEPAPDTGLADVVTLQTRAAATIAVGDEQGFFQDTVAEYTWARDVAGCAPTTLSNLIKPVLEICRFYDCVPWRLTSRQLDGYFAGPGKRAHSTVRQKIIKTDGYFTFLPDGRTGIGRNEPGQ